jgi:ankyrin repeat protein
MQDQRLQTYRRLVEELVEEHRSGKLRAARRIKNFHPERSSVTEESTLRHALKPADASLVIAREAGFDNWDALVAYVEGSDSESYAERFERAADAVIDGDLPTLQELLDADPALARTRSPRPHAATLLHYNCSNGIEDERQRVPENAVDVAKLLIERGANINAMAYCYGGGPGSTPLVGLVTSAHPDEAGLMDDMIRAYAASKQDLDGVEKDGLPVASALLFRNVDAARTLVECGAGVLDIATAAGVGDLDRVKELLVEGTPPKAKGAMPPSPFGWHYDAARAAQLALLIACTAGETEIAEFLLDAGVDPNAPLHQDLTSLHEAAFGGFADIVELLLSRNADVAVRDRQFHATPLAWAEHGGHEDVVALLLKKSDVDLADLVEMGRLELVKSRVESAPEEVNGRDGSGAPLRVAAAAGSLEIVKYLLSVGADSSLRNSQGKSALDWAEENGHGDIAVLLWNYERAAQQNG